MNAANGLGFSAGIGTFNLGGLSGSGSFALSDTGGNAVTLQVGGNGASTSFSGAVGGNGNLAKVGSGTLILSGTNTYSGNTVISQGVLIGGGNNVGSGTIYLMNGATFRPTSGVQGLTAQYYNATQNFYHINSASLNDFLTNYLSTTSNMKMTPTLTNNISQNVANGVNGVFSFDVPGGLNGGNGQGALFPANPSYNYGNGNGVPSGGTATVIDNWAAMYTGFFYAAQSGTYTFGTISDDDSRVWINNVDTAVVQAGTNGQGEPANPTSGTVSLTAGYYPITVGYEEGNGGFGLQVFVTPPGGTQSQIPLSLLSTGIVGSPNFENNMVVGGSATLDLLSGNYTFGTLTIGASGPSTLHVTSGPGSASFGGTIIAGSPTFNVEGSNVLNLGAISGTLTFTTTGSGTVIVSGVNSNTGALSVNLGSLLVVGQNAATGPLGSATIALNNATLGLANSSTGGTTFDLISNNRLSLAGSNDSIIAGSLLAGGSNGAVTLGGAGTLPVAAGQTLNLGAVNGYTLGFAPGLQFSNSGTLSAGPGSISLAASNLAYSGGTFSAASGGTLTMLSPVSSGTFSPAAGGVLILGSTYSGALANLAPAVGGTLVIANNLTAGTLNVANGALRGRQQFVVRASHLATQRRHARRHNGPDGPECPGLGHIQRRHAQLRRQCQPRPECFAKSQ